MSEIPPALDAFELDIKSFLLEKQRQRLAQFDQEALAWLALVPTWTEQLARECGFPGAERLYDFVNEAQAAGLSQLHQSTNLERSTWYMAYVYTVFAPYLPEEHQREALTFVQHIRDDRLRAQSLARFAPHLIEKFVPLMLETAQAITNPATRTVSLLALIPRVSEELRHDLLARLVDAVLSMTDVAEREERIESLLQLIPYFGSAQRLDLIQQVLAWRAELKQESQQVSLLGKLIPRLPIELFPSMIEIVEQFTSIEAKVQLYIALSIQVPTALSKAREALNEDPGLEKGTRTNLLSTLILAFARAGEFTRSLTLAEEVADEDMRARIFVEIVLAMGRSGEVRSALRLTQRILRTVLRKNDVAWNVGILCSIAQALDQIGDKAEATRIVYQARTEADSLVPSAQHVSVLSNLVGTLALVSTEEEATRFVDRALESARSISSITDKCKALIHLLSLIPFTMYDWVVREVLGYIRRIGDSGARIQELTNLAPYLKPDELSEVIDEALLLARTMQEEFSFRMPDMARTEVLTALSLAGPNFLLTRIQEIGPRILRAQRSGLPISPAVARWAELASQARGGTKKVARWLDNQIEQLVKDGNTGQALAWVNTAITLLPVLRSELEMGIVLGNRRVELSYRRIQDEHHLQYFLKRQEQIDAFMQLIQLGRSGASYIWALHYLGIGGIGKTTLIRHITASIAPGLGIPTSRIDFDYLNPDYPSRRPGQLLIEFAKELQAYGTTRKHDGLFASFQQRVVRFHETLNDALRGSDPLASIHHPEFQHVLRAFCDFLGTLPQPVVLILDTCEELAKFHPSGAPPPNLAATFNILQRIHATIPSIRVVFAGRRFLTQGGAEWYLDEQRLQEGQSLLPEQKDYLRLHEIRGFTEEEALYFLTSIKQLDITSALQQAILRRSLDTGTSANVNRLPPRSRQSTARYNPFDLALYADWVREDPRLTPEIINQGKADPYVEMRMINRIRRNDVTRLLPAILLLRRFDKAMLRPAFEGSDAAFTEIYQELGNFEWIEYQPEETTAFLEVDRNLYPRLLEYYRHPERRWSLDVARRDLEAGLHSLMSTLPFNQLHIEYVVTTIKLLPEKDAAILWDQLAQKITDHAAWGRARAITERLLDSNDPIVGNQHPARAAVRATFISVMLHEQPEFSVESFWKEVIETASADPNPTVNAWLHQRAVAGTVADLARTQTIPPSRLLTDFWDVVARFPSPIHNSLAEIYRLEQWAGSLCAALEALLELAEQTGQRDLIPSPNLLARLTTGLQKNSISAAIQAFAFVLAGRAMVLYERWKEAGGLFDQACSVLPTENVQQRWADWRVPASLLDRVRLEILRALPRHLLDLPTNTWPHWQQEAAKRLPAIDADRLISYTLTLHMAREVVSSATLAELTINDADLLEHRPECVAHRVVPPLFVTHALALLAQGKAEEALLLVDRRIQDVTNTGIDRENAIYAATIARISITRCMRTAPATLPFIRWSDHAADPAVVAVLWPAVVLGSSMVEPLPQSIETKDPFLAHVWWRSSTGATYRPGIDVLRTLDQADLTTDAGSSASFEQVSLALDMREAQFLSGESDGDAISFDREKWLSIHPTQPEQALRLYLRAMALDAAPVISPEEEASLSQRFGARWLAGLALDEGELLALRLPHHAKLLLDLASTLFTAVDDPVGAYMATICFVIAAIGSGASINEYQVLKDRLKMVYERLSERGTYGWLPWNELLSVLPLPANQPEIWVAWTQRLLCCALWLDAAEYGDRTTFNKFVTEWLISTYVEILPVELNLPTIEVAATIASGSQSVIQEPSLSPASTSRRVMNLGLQLIAIAVLLTVSGLSGLVLKWLNGGGANTGLESTFGRCNIASCGIAFHDLASILTLCIMLLIPPLIAGTYILLHRLLCLIRADRATQTRLSFSISNVQPGQSKNQSWAAVIRMRQQSPANRFSRLIAGPDTKKSVSVTDRVPGIQAYNDMAKTLPETIVKELAHLQNRLDQRKLQVPLEISPEMSAIPWEALFTLALPTASQVLWSETFQFWRRGKPLLASRKAQLSLEEAAPVVAVLSSSSWQQMVTRGWEISKHNIQIYDDVRDLTRLKNSIKILHAICTPKHTTSGWVLQLEDPTQTYRTASVSVMEQTSRSDSSRHLLRIEDLPLTPALLVVMQAEPVETVQRLVTEREQTADLHSCAALVFASGAQTVIMLPTLPPQLTESVLALLATCYNSQEAPTLQKILDTVSSIRELIARWSPLELDPLSNMQERIVSDTQLELALDVSVFIRA